MSEDRFAMANLTGGQMNAIVKKLGGEEGARRFLRGETVISSPPTPEFKVWKTVKLGTHKNVDALKKALKSSGCRISDWAEDMMKRKAFTLGTRETEVNLVVLSVGDLGFKDGAEYQKICAKAQELGLQLCPAEVGPALRLAYKDQPNGEWLRVAMEAITGSDGSRDIFEVGRRGDGLWLDWGRGYPDDFWFAGVRFVFVLPRK